MRALAVAMMLAACQHTVPAVQAPVVKAPAVTSTAVAPPIAPDPEPWAQSPATAALAAWVPPPPRASDVLGGGRQAPAPFAGEAIVLAEHALWGHLRGGRHLQDRFVIYTPGIAPRILAPALVPPGGWVTDAHLVHVDEVAGTIAAVDGRDGRAFVGRALDDAFERWEPFARRAEPELRRVALAAATGLGSPPSVLEVRLPRWTAAGLDILLYRTRLATGTTTTTMAGSGCEHAPPNQPCDPAPPLTSTVVFARGADHGVIYHYTRDGRFLGEEDLPVARVACHDVEEPDVATFPPALDNTYSNVCGQTDEARFGIYGTETMSPGLR